MKKFIAWVIYSSENPENFSLTIKGALATILPVVVLLVQQLGFTLDSSETEAFALSVIAIITTALTLIGLIRKLVNTFRGKEAVAFVKTKKLSTTTKKKSLPKKK